LHCSPPRTSHILLFLLFFNDPPTTEIYPLSLHDALPICPATPGSAHPWTPPSVEGPSRTRPPPSPPGRECAGPLTCPSARVRSRSEEHTSELQSLTNLVCRLLLEKKKNKPTRAQHSHATT